MAKKGIFSLLFLKCSDKHVGLEFGAIEKRPQIFKGLGDERTVWQLDRRESRLTDLIENDMNITDNRSWRP
jgi:hypothetical protein